MAANQVSLFDGGIVRQDAFDSLKKLSPRVMAKNPVMFVVEIGSVLTTVLWIRDLVQPTTGMAPR